MATIEEGLQELREGRMVILVNEERSDSDGFFCVPAEKVTAEIINHMLHHGRGIIYVTLTDERIRELGIPHGPGGEQQFGWVPVRRIFFGEIGRRAWRVGSRVELTRFRQPSPIKPSMKTW